MANPFKSLEKKIKRGIESLGNNIKRDINNLGNDVRGSIRSAANSAKSEIDQAADRVEKEARDGINTAYSEIRRELDEFQDKLEDELEEAAGEVKEAVTEEFPKLAEKCLSEAADTLQKAVARQGLRILRDTTRDAHRELTKLHNSKPDLVDAINGLGYSLKLGPISLSYANFYNRSEHLAGALDVYVNQPPVFRRGPLIELVKALGPDSVDLGIDISAAFLVVQSDTLSIGGSMDSISLDLFTEIADVVMEALGVPE